MTHGLFCLGLVPPIHHYVHLQIDHNSNYVPKYAAIQGMLYVFMNLLDSFLYSFLGNGHGIA